MQRLINLRSQSRNTMPIFTGGCMVLRLSPYHLARAVLPGMKERNWGRIINITSEVFHCGVPIQRPAAAKGGQIGWSRSMANELPFGITVNTVAPGWIPTERHENDPQEAKDAYLETIPLGRWGTPEDGERCCVFFLGGSLFHNWPNFVRERWAHCSSIFFTQPKQVEFNTMMTQSFKNPFPQQPLKPDLTSYSFSGAVVKAMAMILRLSSKATDSSFSEL